MGSYTWIFTVYGFYSISVTPGGTRVVVRARVREHLEKLKQRFQLDSKIIQLPNRDYLFRILLSKSKWSQILVALANEQTWSNFKDAAKDANTTIDGKDYVSSLHDVWLTMVHLQWRCYWDNLDEPYKDEDSASQRQFPWGKGKKKKDKR
jgi:hypothetical protein